MKKKINCFISYPFSIFIFRKCNKKSKRNRKLWKEVMPDVATITFQIKTKNQNLSVATKDANDRIENLKSALKNKNIDYHSLKLFPSTAGNKKNMIMMITMTAKGKKLPFQVLKVKKPDSYTANIAVLIKKYWFQSDSRSCRIFWRGKSSKHK